LEHGYNTATWTGPLAIDIVKRKFGVEYKSAQIYNILHSLNFSFQKGRGYYPETEERTEESIEDIKKNSKM
jgi:transposase